MTITSMDMRGTVDIYKGSISSLKIDQNMEMAIYALISFSLPFLLPQSQLMLGAVVNSSLVLSAFYLKGRKVIPAIVLPSIGAVLRGMMFGPSTAFLIYMLPFIWAGNALLVGGMKLLYGRMKLAYALSSAMSIAAKVLLLFGSAYVLYSFGLVPAVFLASMGVMQAITAAIGCSSAYAIDIVRERSKE
jgi:hypothetical protein